VQIPTNRRIQRKRLPTRAYGSGEEKWKAIVAEVVELHRAGRPVLIGTRTIEKSELLSQLLDLAGIGHQVLNANRIAEEAEIVARAGQSGKVTVATNMAGRGTDIKLGPGVAEMGGLHVICTEIHDSARIDRQLSGRCGRQGDPGTSRQYLALDDDILLSGLGPQAADKWRKRGEMQGGDLPRLASLFRKAQRRIERRHLRDRMILLHHEKERKKMQRELGQDPHLDTPT
jgi:preprotein translocase subunit SecA